MTNPQRLAFLIETVELEAQHLLDTDRRLFAQCFSADRAIALRVNIDESERTDAFVARFGRLQDTVPLLVNLARAISADCRRRGLVAQ